MTQEEAIQQLYSNITLYIDSQIAAIRNEFLNAPEGSMDISEFERLIMASYEGNAFLKQSTFRDYLKYIQPLLIGNSNILDNHLAAVLDGKFIDSGKGISDLQEKLSQEQLASISDVEKKAALTEVLGSYYDNYNAGSSIEKKITFSDPTILEGDRAFYVDGLITIQGLTFDSGTINVVRAGDFYLHTMKVYFNKNYVGILERVVDYTGEGTVLEDWKVPTTNTPPPPIDPNETQVIDTYDYPSQTYTVTAETKSFVLVASLEEGGTIILPNNLIENKGITFTLSKTEQATTIGGVLYNPGDVIFAFFSTNSGWSVNSTNETVISNYDDIVVDYASNEDIPFTLFGGYYYTEKTNTVIYTDASVGDLVFFKNQTDKSKIGIYKKLSAGIENDEDTDIYQLIVAGINLKTVRVINSVEQGSWINEWDGNTLSTLKFERLIDKADKLYNNGILNTYADYLEIVEKGLFGTYTLGQNALISSNNFGIDNNTLIAGYTTITIIGAVALNYVFVNTFAIDENENSSLREWCLLTESEEEGYTLLFTVDDQTNNIFLSQTIFDSPTKKYYPSVKAVYDKFLTKVDKESGKGLPDLPYISMTFTDVEFIDGVSVPMPSGLTEWNTFFATDKIVEEKIVGNTITLYASNYFEMPAFIFNGNENITFADLNCITGEIGYKAFYETINLTSIILGEKTSIIGNSSFGILSITEITIPNSVTSIGEHAFLTCEYLATVNIGNLVQSIGTDAFSECFALTTLTIPNSVITIGPDAFYNCSSLATLTAPSRFKGNDAIQYLIDNYETEVTWVDVNPDKQDVKGADELYVSSTEKSTWNGKQEALSSGTNIKTIGGDSILGSGNLPLQYKQVDTDATSGTNTITANSILNFTTQLTNAHTLTITEGTAVTGGYGNEWVAQFYTGSTAPAITFAAPDGVTIKWVTGTPTIAINTYYTLAVFKQSDTIYKARLEGVQ